MNAVAPTSILLSVHMPKAGGTSFYRNLAAIYGPRLLWHNSDWVEVSGMEADARRARHRADLIGDPVAFRRNYDAIHGHFAAGKYLPLFPNARLVTFVRDPFQHAVSSWEFGMRSASLPHPGHEALKARNLSVPELVEMYPNHQSAYVDDVPLEDFAMIGIFERYDESLALFETLFGVPIPQRAMRENANPQRPSSGYVISPEVRRAVERHRAADLDLYRRAVERFDHMRAAFA